MLKIKHKNVNISETWDRENFDKTKSTIIHCKKQ